ncbi:Deoxyribonuclease-2-alpha, partial [Trichinella nativa]
LTTLIYLLDLMQSLLNLRISWRAILYKAPGQATGKIIEATDAARDWQDGAQPLNNNAQHSFATALQHVVGDNQNVKFLAYNNAPPGVPSIKTKSNSKGIIILSIAPATDSAAWIVHTVPGFPAAKTGYNWPLAENARGHLLICLTISESQINAIAASLLLVQPLIHYNDIPKTETAGMPYFNKLAEGKIPTLPPFTSRQTIPNLSHLNMNSVSQTFSGYCPLKRAILYKAPGQATGKIIEATAAAGDWQDGAQALSNPNQHSFATALQHVVGDDPNAKFLAYNNAPPGVPSIKTKSNSKGVIILATNADSAAW